MSDNKKGQQQFGQHSVDPAKPMIERMRDGELYMASDAECQAEMEKTKVWLGRLNASLGAGAEARDGMLAERIGTIGHGTTILPPFFCDYGTNIHLGTNVFLNYNCCVLDVCAVHIGDGTVIGPAVQIYTADHPRDFGTRQAGWEYGRPIRIGANVWIGGGAIVLPGITIGDNAIVGAGAVVTKDVPEGTTVVGNPARPLAPKKEEKQ